MRKNNVGKFSFFCRLPQTDRRQWVSKANGSCECERWREKHRLITRNRTHFWCLGLLYVALRRHPLRSASTNPRSPGREVNRYELRNWNTGCGAEKASMPRLQQMRRKKRFLFASERSFKFTLTHSSQSYQKITFFFLKHCDDQPVCMWLCN